MLIVLRGKVTCPLGTTNKLNIRPAFHFVSALSEFGEHASILPTFAAADWDYGTFDRFAGTNYSIHVMIDCDFGCILTEAHAVCRCSSARTDPVLVCFPLPHEARFIVASLCHDQGRMNSGKRW
jgi:hypothetical protein